MSKENKLFLHVEELSDDELRLIFSKMSKNELIQYLINANRVIERISKGYENDKISLPTDETLQQWGEEYADAIFEMENNDLAEIFINGARSVIRYIESNSKTK